MTNMNDFLNWARDVQQNNNETKDQMRAMNQPVDHLAPMEITPSIEDAIRGTNGFHPPNGKLNEWMSVVHRPLRRPTFVVKKPQLRPRSKSLGGWFG